MSITKFLVDFSEAIELDPNTAPLSPETVFKDLDCWDSMNALNVIAMVDDRYNRSIGGDEIEHSKTILDLWNKLGT